MKLRSKLLQTNLSK